jgi:phenylalanyl-tRNA synthetase alpha chain
MQLLLDQIHAALPAPVVVHRASPVVSVADNYDRLGYPPDGPARDTRYTRYVCETAVLRTQTSALVPPVLRSLGAVDDVVLSCAGIVYRRDAIDRLHVGEPHQVDLWRIARRPLGGRELGELIAGVVAAALPGATWRTLPTTHPYTTDGLQIDVDVDGSWVEIGECGLAARAILDGAGLTTHQGLAMGLGLDRLVMLRKAIPDVRVLRARDPRIARQMLDLSPYVAVSTMPPVRRDLSLAVDPPADAEALGDAARAALGDRAELVEALEIVAVTPYHELSAAAIERLGMQPDQLNVLVRVVLRALDRTLTHAECNALRDDVYRALHRGRAWQWARPPRRLV